MSAAEKVASEAAIGVLYQTLNQVRFLTETGFEDSAIKIIGGDQCAQCLLEGSSRVVASCRRRTIDRAIGFLDPVVHSCTDA